ncbi:MAG TPA: HEAT repeat domain-containing protein [Acidimicrobiales bacterium]|nr:HEAT repeat domain-containing protein [Acidimicrobiales bacterium]
MVRRCLGLLAGGSEDPQFILTLGGEPALRLLDEGMPAGQRYWVRVWAARGLLWAGPGDDIDVLRAALDDEHWRVREMTCKVAARHRLGDLLDDMAALASDPVPRVRSAAERAAASIVAAGA